MIRPPKSRYFRAFRPRHLFQRKSVTICAAGINGLSIIAISDTKLSFFGGSISGEGMAHKARDLTKNWTVMFAGDVSTLTPLLDAVEEAAKENDGDDLRHFARTCAHAYKKERENIIEDEVLQDYDLKTYAEYLALKQSNPTLFDAISTKIHDVEEGWNLLFCGFIGKMPHIFVISHRGKIQYCDTEGFAAIGTGAWAASVSLVSHPYSKGLVQSEAAYCLLVAKFAAESAEGVGAETTLRVLRAGDTWASFLGNEIMEKTKTKWKSLPRIPEGISDALQSELTNNEGLMHALTKQIRGRKRPVIQEPASRTM